MKNGLDETRQLLSVVMEFISRSSERDLRSLLDGTSKLEIVEKASSKSNRKAVDRPSISDGELQNVFTRLADLESREAGIELLKVRIPTRKLLEAFARRIDMPVRKDDNIDRMRERIVDQTIGSRLNSLAIRGGSKDGNSENET